MSIARKLRTEANYLFFRKYRNDRLVRRHLLDAYTDEMPRPDAEKPMVVMKLTAR